MKRARQQRLALLLPQNEAQDRIDLEQQEPEQETSAMARTIYILSRSSMDAVAAMTPDWGRLSEMVEAGTLMAPKAVEPLLSEETSPASPWVHWFPDAFIEPPPQAGLIEMMLRSEHPKAAAKEDADRSLNMEAVAMAMNAQSGDPTVVFAPVVAGDARVRESIYEIVDEAQDPIMATTPVELLHENDISFTPPPRSLIGLRDLLKDFQIPETDLYGDAI